MPSFLQVAGGKCRKGPLNVKVYCVQISSVLGCESPCWVRQPLETQNGTRTVHQGLYKFGFCGHAAAYKSKITTSNGKHQLEWRRARHYWAQERWKCILWLITHSSPSGSLTNGSRTDVRIWIWLRGRLTFPTFHACILPAEKFDGGGIRIV